MDLFYRDFFKKAINAHTLQDLTERADNFSRRVGLYMHVATLHAVHGKGVRGQVPPRKF